MVVVEVVVMIMMVVIMIINMTTATNILFNYQPCSSSLQETKFTDLLSCDASPDAAAAFEAIDAMADS